MTIQTTRRAVLAGAPAIALVATIPGTLKAAPSALRGEWDAAMASYQRAKAAEDAFLPVWRNLSAKCQADCENIPHIVLRPDPYTGRSRPITTADTSYIRLARQTVQELDAGKIWVDPTLPDVQAHFQLQRDLVDAADDYESDIQGIRDSYAMDDADERCDAIGDAIADAAAVLMGIPAPDMAALRWKIDYLTDGGEEWAGWEGGYAAQTLADIARLLPTAA